jgi:hypothetical protein
LANVAENLYRSESSGIYYAVIKSDGKQIRRSPRTNDPQLARRRLADFRKKITRLSTDDGKTLLFAEHQDGKLVAGLAKRWFDVASLRWKSPDREMYTVNALAQHFGGLTVRNITVTVIEK